MAQISPLETKRRFHNWPAVCPIRAFLGGCEPAYLCVAIERGLVPNLDRIWQKSMSHIAHFFIPSYKNPSPENSDMGRGNPTRNKTDTVFCSRGGLAQMYGELTESPATAYRA